MRVGDSAVVAKGAAVSAVLGEAGRKFIFGKSSKVPILLDTDLLVLHITGDSKLETLRRASRPGNPLELPVRALLEQRRVPLEIYHAP